MRRFSQICVAMSLIAFSCQSPSSSLKLQELRVNIHTDPPSLDPRKATDTTSNSVIRMCFDGLMRRDENGNRSFGVAQSVDISDDGLKYTFYLKETTWSDGEPVTAKNFEDAWKTILDPQFLSEFASELYVIKNGQKVKESAPGINEIGVRALDTYVLEVELENPAPYFLDMLVTHSFFPVPSHVVEKNPQWALNAGASYVCNGPFHLEQWKHYNTIVLEKNNRYWDKDAVSIERIDLYMIEDESTELSMYENGEIEWVGSPLSSIPVDALPILEKEKDFKQYEISGTYYYIFNTKAYPFTNKHIRRAFSIAINRKEIIDNILQANQMVATSYIPPSMWKYTKSYFADADIVEAKKEFALGLTELGITAKEMPPIKLSYNTNSGHHKIAQAIKEEWSRAFGIRVDLENMEWKVFLDNVNTHKFQIARMGGIASYNDPVSFFRDYQYPNSRMNPCQWSNVRFTELMELSDQTQDAEKRMKILSEAEKVFMEEMPIAPIYFYTGSYMKKPYVKSVQVSQLSDIDFKYAYLEKR